MSSDASSAPVRSLRRYFRYSLRSLFGLMTLVAIGLGYWTSRAQNQRSQDDE